MHNEFWPWPISSWSFAHEFAVLEILSFRLHTIFPAIGGMLFIPLTLQSAQGFAKNWTLNHTVTFLLLAGSFSYLVLVFTTKMCHIQLLTLTHICICSLLCQYMGQCLQIVMKGQQGWVGRIIFRMQAFMCLVTSMPSTLNESHPYFYLSSKFYFFFDIWVHIHSSKILCAIFPVTLKPCKPGQGTATRHLSENSGGLGTTEHLCPHCKWQHAVGILFVDTRSPVE